MRQRAEGHVPSSSASGGHAHKRPSLLARGWRHLLDRLAGQERGHPLAELQALGPWDETVQRVIRASFIAAHGRGHEWVYRTHFLVALLSDPAVGEMLAQKGIDVSEVASHISANLKPSASPLEPSTASSELFTLLKDIARRFSLTEAVLAPND